MGKRGRPKQSQGLGDTISKITEATGIDKLVKDDCGCEERRQMLNKLFEYKLKVVNCPTVDDENWFKSLTKDVNNEDRKRLCGLYASTFNVPYYEPCVGCSPKPYIEIYNKLKKVII